MTAPAVEFMRAIAAFLRARLDEDEAVAKAAPYELDNGEWTFWPEVDSREDFEATNAYRDRFPPARRLAEIEGDRQIIALCETETPETGGLPLALRTLRQLARRHHKHPEFKEEWVEQGT